MSPDIFPITKVEHDALFKFGWNSGFGWSSGFDWFHAPCEGKPIWVDDDPELMRRFLSDLEGIRATEAERLRKERLGTVGPQLLVALKDALNFVPDFPSHDPQHYRLEAMRAAIAKAEGVDQ